MGDHINSKGKFQSDKYPTTPPGKVPLSVSDTTAQDLLWAYAQRRRAVDADFAADLETCLRAAGYDHRPHHSAPSASPAHVRQTVHEAAIAELFAGTAPSDIVPLAKRIASRVALQLAGHVLSTEERAALQERVVLQPTAPMLGTEEHCPIHYGLIHGGEAEELRAGIERLIEKSHGYVDRSKLQQLVDSVDARDSLAHLERQDATAQLSDADRTALQYLRDKAPWRDGRNDKCHAALIRAINLLLGDAR